MSGTTSLENLVAALIDSWNDGDAWRFGSLFGEGAEYVTGQGARIEGRKAIADLLTSGRTEKVSVDEGPSIRVYGSVASVVFSWRSGSSARRGVISLVAIRDEGSWYIDRLQSTDMA
jgi:uncharacterized protein (TIGR02246 family)